MEIEQIQDINLEQLKKDIEADDNIVSFALFYDRKGKKMYFVKHGDEGIIDKMVNKAAYSVAAFANTISKIAWRWNKNDTTGKDTSKWADPFYNPLTDIFGRFKK